MDFVQIENDQQMDRILYLSSEISDGNTSDICKKILAINDLDNKNIEKFKKYMMQPIELHIQSFGGSIYDMFSLIDIIESSSTPIVTYCNGYCMSAAALIFLAGHYRCMYKNSSLMLHQISVWNFGKINDVEITFDESRRLHKKILKFIKKRTGLKKSFFKKFDNEKEDIYLTAKKCLKYGICDEIVKKADWRSTLLEQMSKADTNFDMI